MSTADDIKAAAAAGTEAGTLSQAATTDGAILAALEKLDPKNEEHWNNDGKPSMDALNALLLAPTTRKHLDEIAPDFRRPGETVTLGAGDVGSLDEVLGNAGGQPPIDNEHVADGETQFTDDEVKDNRTVEERLDALEADSAFLRNQFGWPTK